jgi:hypothetical protein
MFEMHVKKKRNWGKDDKTKNVKSSAHLQKTKIIIVNTNTTFLIKRFGLSRQQ